MTQNKTEPPKTFKGHRFHWLSSERAEDPSIAEWMHEKWYCVNENQPVNPEEMFRRGWDWAGIVEIPERLTDR